MQSSSGGNSARRSGGMQRIPVHQQSKEQKKGLKGKEAKQVKTEKKERRAQLETAKHEAKYKLKFGNEEQVLLHKLRQDPKPSKKQIEKERQLEEVAQQKHRVLSSMMEAGGTLKNEGIRAQLRQEAQKKVDDARAEVEDWQKAYDLDWAHLEKTKETWSEMSHISPDYKAQQDQEVNASLQRSALRLEFAQKMLEEAEVELEVLDSAIAASDRAAEELREIKAQAAEELKKLGPTQKAAEKIGKSVDAYKKAVAKLISLPERDSSKRKFNEKLEKAAENVMLLPENASESQIELANAELDKASKEAGIDREAVLYDVMNDPRVQARAEVNKTLAAVKENFKNLNNQIEGLKTIDSWIEDLNKNIKVIEKKGDKASASELRVLAELHAKRTGFKKLKSVLTDKAHKWTQEGPDASDFGRFFKNIRQRIEDIARSDETDAVVKDLGSRALGIQDSLGYCAEEFRSIDSMLQAWDASIQYKADKEKQLKELKEFKNTWTFTAVKVLSLGIGWFFMEVYLRSTKKSIKEAGDITAKTLDALKMLGISEPEIEFAPKVKQPKTPEKPKKVQEETQSVAEQQNKHLEELRIGRKSVAKEVERFIDLEEKAWNQFEKSKTPSNQNGNISLYLSYLEYEEKHAESLLKLKEIDIQSLKIENPKHTQFEIIQLERESLSLYLNYLTKEKELAKKIREKESMVSSSQVTSNIDIEIERLHQESLKAHQDYEGFQDMIDRIKFGLKQKSIADEDLPPPPDIIANLIKSGELLGGSVLSASSASALPPLPQRLEASVISLDASMVLSASALNLDMDAFNLGAEVSVSDLRASVLDLSTSMNLGSSTMLGQSVVTLEDLEKSVSFVKSGQNLVDDLAQKAGDFIGQVLQFAQEDIANDSSKTIQIVNSYTAVLNKKYNEVGIILNEYEESVKQGEQLNLDNLRTVRQQILEAMNQLKSAHGL